MARRWLITGVSSGLGRSLMEAVIRNGDTVAGTVRTLPPEDPYAGAGPGRGKLFMLDVARADGIAAPVRSAIDWLGGVDVVVNNAGSGMFGPLELCSIDDYRKAMEVNYFGLLGVTKAALPGLRASKGTLINVTSMAAFLAMGGTTAYTASKHAALGVTESLRDELAPLGVRVIASLPGGFRTDFWSERSNTIREGMDDLYGDQPSGQVRERSQAHVGNELGDPAKLARLMIEIVESDEPPFYFVPGADAVDSVGAKRDAMAAELETQRAVAEATAYG